MRKDIKKYIKVWKLRQKGMTFKEIAEEMGYKSKERPRQMVAYINHRLKTTFPPLSKELKEIIKENKNSS